MEPSIKDQPVANQDALRRLAQEHSQYSQRLSALTEKRYLSDEEKLEEVRLKKLKLKLKDEMTQIQLNLAPANSNVA